MCVTKHTYKPTSKTTPFTMTYKNNDANFLCLRDIYPQYIIRRLCCHKVLQCVSNMSLLNYVEILTSLNHNIYMKKTLINFVSYASTSSHFQVFHPYNHHKYVAYTLPSMLSQKDENYLKVNWVQLGRVNIGYAVSIDMMSLFAHVIDLGPILDLDDQ